MDFYLASHPEYPQVFPMGPFHVLTATEQVTGYLREELRRGTWHEKMPGEDRLVAQLGVGRDTIKMALRSLEKEGLLVGQGVGRRRKVVLPEGGFETPVLRVAILDYEPMKHTEQWGLAMRQQLLDQGHNAFFTEKCLLELGMDFRRVARLVKRTPADVWVVCSASREVLEWFSVQKILTFALFGDHSGLPIASTVPDKKQAIAEATRRLVALGHHRISFLCQRDVRLPQPGMSARAFLDELKATGITTSEFNLPDWEGNRESFGRLLDSLFELTPPTALILDESYVYHAGFHHLARLGLRVPEDVSLICTDPDPTYVWCNPSVAHIRWDYRLVVRRVLRWVNNVARGKKDLRQTHTKAEFVDGGTVGRAPR